MGEMKSIHIFLVGNPEGSNRQLGRSRRRWEDNFRMELKETGWGGVNWMRLAQDMDQWRVLGVGGVS
jgi:hypothetical protein